MPFRGTRWSRPAGTLFGAGRMHQTQLHVNATAQARVKNTRAPPSERESQIQVERLAWSSTSARVPVVEQLHKKPNVDPDSLRNTLEAYREANRASLIVKIAGKGSIRQHLDLPSRLYRRGEPTRRNDAVVTGTSTWNPRTIRRVGRRRSNARPEIHTKEEFLAEWAPNSCRRYSKRYPWMKHMSPHVRPELEGRPAGIEELSREIDAFYSYLQPSSTEKQAAELALREVSAAIQKVDQNIKIDVVGSRATGLALSMSDIDLNIANSSTTSNIRVIKELLTKVASCLKTDSRDKGLVRSIKTRFRSKIPLVTGRHASTYLEFQVQSTVDVFLTMQQTMSFVNEFPTLPKLFVLLKQMLMIRGLNLGSMQGITSYPLIVMIVAALKFSEGRLDRRNLGGHFLYFLDMYSEINFTTTAISFSPLQYVVKRHPNSATLPNTRSATPTPDSCAVGGVDNEREPQEVDARRRFATIKPDAEYLMCLQDPADLQNDLGKSAMRIREIQSVFVRSREELRIALQAWDDGERDSRPVPLLAPCIGADYRIFESARHHLAACAPKDLDDSSPAKGVNVLEVGRAC